MRAILHHLHSPDLFDLEHGLPADPTHFGILVQAMIGPDDGVGVESFDFVVCTPSWLALQVQEGSYLFGRHYLFLARYDYAVLHRAITHICNIAHGENWTSIASVIARYGRWEFEDYSGSLPPG